MWSTIRTMPASSWPQATSGESTRTQSAQSPGSSATAAKGGAVAFAARFAGDSAGSVATPEKSIVWALPAAINAAGWE